MKGDKRDIISEMISLGVMLKLPKGTEHFMSDIHGEHEAFTHVRKSASGVIRHKIDALFADEMSCDERAELAFIVYYPKEKLADLKERCEISEERLTVILHRLIMICRLLCDKYTRERIRQVLSYTAEGYSLAIEELLALQGGRWRTESLENSLKSIVRLGAAEDFIEALSDTARELAVDRWHIVGDIFDRGPRADIVLDELMRIRSIDIEWGNHDALWMGAAAGSRACVATAIANSLSYRNIELLELGYGINLKDLCTFARDVYGDRSADAFLPRGGKNGGIYSDKEISLMYKAISIIAFKLDGECIMRNPDFMMEERLFLEKIDTELGEIVIDGTRYELCDGYFPTIEKNSPYKLSKRESYVINKLAEAFLKSEKLHRHVRFLYEVGSTYKIYNRNLLFHGAVPMSDDGEFLRLPMAGGLFGRELLDFLDKEARRGYFSPEGSPEREHGRDVLWFLWCGKNSPLCARERIATLERLLIKNGRSFDEPKNAYYRVWDSPQLADKILREFSLPVCGSHIINGHIPVKRGESPIKSGGKVIVIDGGFCSAYTAATGIAGYTLIYNADGMRLCAHESFTGTEDAIKSNKDIHSKMDVFEQKHRKIRVRDTNEGAFLYDRIAHLMEELRLYH